MVLYSTNTIQPMKQGDFGSFDVLLPDVMHAFDNIHLDYGVSMV